MLHGCMLEYLKGKTHEQEVEGLPSVGYQRSIFFNKFMISFILFLTQRAALWLSNTFCFQMCNHYVTTIDSIVVVKYCTQ